MDRHEGATRRDFLKIVGGGACAACARAVPFAALNAGVRGAIASEADLPRPQAAVRDAMWFDALPDKAVKCTLCPRACVVADVERGYCGVRENQGGKYKTLVYGNLCSLNVDPIEKKPLFHYLPGTTALSVATVGCNIECKFCQNWEISQFRPEQVPSRIVPPEALAAAARERGIPTIAYTYSEPVVFYEYMHDAAAAGRKQGVGSAIISNGYIQEPALRQLCGHLTAVKVDLKAFTETFYRDVCAGELKPVLRTLEVLADLGIHTEVVVLLIPELNDSAAEIRDMSKWLFKTLGPDVPVHFSRFHPIYRMKNLPPTPVATIERARKTALDAGLRYVYVGNVPFHEGEHTYCPSCGKIVIRRVGYRVDASNLKDGKCAGCGTAVAGVWTQQQALSFRPKPKA
jgi:pyruvate formate lyase activating enzyme